MKYHTGKYDTLCETTTSWRKKMQMVGIFVFLLTGILISLGALCHLGEIFNFVIEFLVSAGIITPDTGSIAHILFRAVPIVFGLILLLIPSRKEEGEDYGELHG